MADKYFVGQFVRLKSGDYNSDSITLPLGAKGYIDVEKDFEGDYEVMFYYHPCPSINDPAWFIDESDLEPISDKNEKSSWSECAWKPSWIKSHG
jgi:hypothetical protein